MTNDGKRKLVMGHSPVFVATFSDGTQTRMTVWHDPERKTLNLDRGIRLAGHAYRSRMGKKPPPIVAAHFERDGEILASYTASELTEEGGIKDNMRHAAPAL